MVDQPIKYRRANTLTSGNVGCPTVRGDTAGRRRPE
jgi:hypothetical protein